MTYRAGRLPAGVVRACPVGQRRPFSSAGNFRHASFRAGPAAVVLGQIMVQEPDPPRLHRADLDPTLEVIGQKAMAKKVEDRYASMAELADALGAFLRTAGPAGTAPPQPAAGPRAGGPPPAVPPTMPPRRA